MKITFINLFYALALLFTTTLSRAQNAGSNTPFAGEKGVFIYHPLSPESPKYPVNGFTGYQLEREDAASPGNWLKITEWHTPQNAAELYHNYQKAAGLFKDAKLIRFNAEATWAKYMKYKSLDSLAFELAYTPVQMAFGVLIADTTIKKNGNYRYRISQTGSPNGQSLITNAAAFPGTIKAIKPRVLNRITENDAIRIEWFARGEYSNFMFKVFRRDDNDKVFKEIRPYISTDLKNDTLKYAIRDEQVKFSGIYHYYIAPVNSFGGGGNVHSDTITASCMNPKLLTTAQYFSATPDTVLKAIRINYKLPAPQFIGSIAVMRSTSYDDNYEKVGIALPTDTSYVDLRVAPGQKYYYYLMMNDKTGREGIRSIKTFGLYQNNRNDFPVSNVTATQQGDNVIIKWENPAGEPVSGFYVYRCEGVGMPLKRLTTLIAAHDSTGSYTDTFALKPGVMYGYSVRSENASNKESRDSKIAYISAIGTDSALVAPKSLAANAEGKGIRLTWVDMRLLNGTLSGYRITRRSSSQNQAVVLQGNYATVFNGYLDSTAVAGEQYQYNVECLAGSSSAMASVNSAMPYVGYTAPSGLTGFNAANGINLLWGKVYDKRVKQFAIYRYTRDSDAQLVAKVPSTNLKFTDTRAAKGQTWYYYVRSVGDANQVSAKSNEVYIEY